MKRKIAMLILALSLVISTTACGSDNKEEATEPEKKEETSKEELSENTKDNMTEQDIPDNTEPENTLIIEPKYEDGSIEKEIQDYAANLITENYTFTDIHEISINENAGTEEAGDYIILARLIWNQENSGSTSKKVLEMYSSDFAARVGNDQPSVNQVAIFWTVPYLGDANAKWAYDRKGEGMFLSDNMMDAAFNQ